MYPINISCMILMMVWMGGCGIEIFDVVLHYIRVGACQSILCYPCSPYTLVGGDVQLYIPTI